MKRLLTYQIYFFIIAFLAFANIAKSQNTTVSFLDSYSFNDTFQAVIYVDSFSSLGAITLSFNYDTAALELLNIEQDVAFTSSFYDNSVGNEVFLAWFNTTPITQVDTFVNITFRKKIDFCETPITWGNITQVSDSIGVTLTTNFNPGELIFLTAESPTTLFPQNNATGIPVNSIFRWRDWDMECVDNYHFQIASDTNFTQLLIDTLVTDSFFVVTNLPELSMNYWRVAKVDKKQNEYWSAFQTASTKSIDTTSVSIPNIITWEDTVNIVIDFINNEPLGLFDLEIEYDTTALQFLGFSNSLVNISVSDTLGEIQLDWQTQTEPIILPNDTLIELLFLKKTACITPLDWSASSGFYFNNNTPQLSNFNNGSLTFADSTTTNLLFPNDGSVEVFIRPELTWNDIFCSNGYQVQVSQNPNFSTLLIDTFLVDTTYIPTILQGDSLYYWRVGRYNILDSLYWSDTLDFMTESVLPITVTAHDLITENDTFSIPIQIDSLANAIGFELFLNYDTTAIDFIGFTDTTTLIANLIVQNNNGTIQINWNSTDSTVLNTANIPSDTLLQLQFVHLDSCETLISWQTDTTDFYHINTTINIDANFENALIVFLQNEIPQQIPTAAMTTIHPDFYWQTMNCVENYHFQLSLDDQFTQIVTDSLLSDTTIWQPNLQQSTTYFWRVAKEDFVGDLFWSDTLSFTTGLFYTTTLTIDSLLTYDDTAKLTLVVDSVFYLNGFQFDINYNENEMAFVGLSDTLFAGIQTTTNNGILTITWSDSINYYDIIQDTLLIMNFENTAACQNFITWNNQTLNFRENVNLLNPMITNDGSVEFLNTNAPILLSPFYTQTSVYPIVNFNFQAIECTERYQVQIATSNDFLTILLDSFVVDTFLNSIILDHNSMYFWRVGRWDSQADLYWSDTLSFQTEVLPILQITAENVVTYEDTIAAVITILDAVWAEAFEFDLAYEGFEFLGSSDLLLADLTIIENNDTINFAWQTVGTTLNDWLTTTSDTLAILYFQRTTLCETPLEWTFAEATYKNELIPIVIKTNDGYIRWVNDAIPNLVFAPNDTIFMPTNFDLSWQAVDCSESYWLQVAKDSLFNKIVVDEMMLLDTFYTVENLETYQDYYWQIGQEDSEGIFHWSSVWTFQTDRTHDDNHLIFPNPADEFINIWFENEISENATVQLFSESGQLIENYTTTITNKQIQLNVNALSRGTYFIRFMNEEFVWTEKIVVY